MRGLCRAKSPSLVGFTALWRHLDHNSHRIILNATPRALTATVRHTREHALYYGLYLGGEGQLRMGILRSDAFPDSREFASALSQRFFAHQSEPPQRHVVSNGF